MQITLPGATGATGQQVLTQALDAGHRLTVLVRDPGRLAQRGDERITTVVGDATATDDVKRAATGSEALISTLGTGRDFTAPLATRAAQAALTALPTAGVTRLVWLSALGAGETRHRQSYVQRTAARLLMKNLMADKGAADGRIAVSGLDWTVVLPVMLTNGPFTGTYRALDAEGSAGRVGGRVSRADLADLLLTAATSRQWSRRRVIVTH